MANKLAKKGANAPIIGPEPINTVKKLPSEKKVTVQSTELRKNYPRRANGSLLYGKLVLNSTGAISEKRHVDLW